MDLDGASGTVVFKIGGSLLAWPPLRARLVAALQPWREAGHRVALLTGGGRLVDAIREIDRAHRLGDSEAHRLAVLGMDLTAELLAAAVGNPALPLAVVREPAELPDAWRRGRLPVLAPSRWLAARDASTADPLPQSWDVTSDAIAARLARELAADALLLLKSRPLPVGSDLRDAVRRGLVDAWFPDMAAPIPRVGIINLRDEGAPQLVWFRHQRGEPPQS
jgi:aspartokinase-like uncharacterized kinase